MKEKAISRINDFGKIGNVIVIIMKVISIIALVTTIIITGVMLFVPRDFIQFSMSGQETVTIDMSALGKILSEEDRKSIDSGAILNDGYFSISNNNNRFKVNEISTEGNKIIVNASEEVGKPVSLRDFVYVLAATDVLLIITVVSLFAAGFLCKAFATCDSPFNNNVITNMSRFAYSLIPWVFFSSIVESLNSSLMTGKPNVSYSIDLSMVIVVLIILALVQIFKYGAILQQESDETL